MTRIEKGEWEWGGWQGPGHAARYVWVMLRSLHFSPSNTGNTSGVLFSSVQSLSRVWLFAIPWSTACRASLSITNFQSLLKLMCIESVMPSNHLIISHQLLLLQSIFPSTRVFSNESVLHIRWPRYWSFSFSISPSNKYSGLISFRINYLRVSSHTTVWKRQFFGAQVSL